jgi:hypothetical protein
MNCTAFSIFLEASSAKTMICLSTGSCCMIERFEHLSLQWFTHEPFGAIAVWAGPVSTLRWVPLSAYAAGGNPATCSKAHAVQ